MLTEIKKLLNLKNLKTAFVKAVFKRGGEQGSRTLSSAKRIFCVSDKGASTSAILSVSRHAVNYIINLFSEQNKNILNNNEDVFVDSLMENKVSLSDTFYSIAD